MLLSQFIKKLPFAIIAMLLVIGVANANTTKKNSSNCSYRAFDIKISDSVTTREALNQLSDMCEFSIVVKDAEAEKVLGANIKGINIKNMALFEVFDLLLKEQNVNYNFKRNVLQVYSIDTKTFKIDYITSVREGTAVVNASVDVKPVEVGEDDDDSDSKSGNEIKTTEKFNFWETLDAEIKALLNNGTEEYEAADPIININAGLITVTGTNSQLTRVGNYLKELKSRLHKQVMIDVSIISVELGNDYSTGINWKKFQLGINTKHNSSGNLVSTGSADATFYNTLNNSAKNLNIINNLNFSMEGLLNFISERGKSKIISSPKVMTLNNQQALITIGDNINYRVQEESQSSTFDSRSNSFTLYSIFIGVMLNLLPEVSDDGQIMLRINPSLSSFKYAEDDQKQTTIREIAPDTLEKKLSTVVKVNSGDTIILGGLIGQTKSKSKTSVPVLGDLPLLGAAFKSTTDAVSTTELVFVITPHIINKSSKSVKPTLKLLGYSESIHE